MQYNYLLNFFTLSRNQYQQNTQLITQNNQHSQENNNQITLAPKKRFKQLFLSEQNNLNTQENDNQEVNLNLLNTNSLRYDPQNSAFRSYQRN